MALVLNELNKGIYDKLNVSSITDLLNGGINHYKAPQGTQFPFIVYFIVTDVRADTFDNWRDDILLQIDIFSDSNSAEEAENIAEKVAAQMDEASITATGYNVFFCQRGETRLFWEEENSVFHKVMEYRIVMSKSK